MKRLHIDKNTLSNIWKQEKEVYKKLYEILDNNRDIFFMSYSSAHIQDLSNDDSDIKLEEAAFIEKFIGNYYLSYNAVNKDLGFFLKSPVEILKNQKPIDFSFDNLFDAFDDSDPILKSVINIIKEQFKVPTLNLEVDSEGLKPYENTLAQFLPYNEGPKSINDFIYHFRALHENLSDKNSLLYKETRKTNIDLLKFNQNQNLKNADDIDNILLKSGIGKTLHELIMQMGGSEPSWNEYFLRGFIALNMLALDNEKNKKAKFNNLINDADHAYYASHADILITEDIGFRFKAGILYQRNNIKTIIMSPQEFIDYFEKLEIKPMNSAGDFIELLREQLPDQPSETSKSANFNRITSFYDLNSSLFNYFDHLEFISDNDIGKFYVLTAKKSYYSISLFYKEIELITNNLNKVLGDDVAQKGLYTEEDDKQLRANKWEGRLWAFGRIPATLEINKGSQKLSLVIGPFHTVQEQEEVKELTGA